MNSDQQIQPHKFEPHNPKWFKPRCKICKEFEYHLIHDPESKDVED